MLKATLALALASIGWSQARNIVPGYTGTNTAASNSQFRSGTRETVDTSVTGGYDHPPHSSTTTQVPQWLNPHAIYRNVTKTLTDVSGIPLDGPYLPIVTDPTEDLKKFTGQCLTPINLVQILPAGSVITGSQFAHIKRMVHFMLDGWLLGDNHSHACIISTGNGAETAFGLGDSTGRNNLAARKHVAQMEKPTGEADLAGAVARANAALLEDGRKNVVHVVIIHANGDAICDTGLSAAILSIQAVPRLIPIVIAYGDGLYKSSTCMASHLDFAECLDIEFCPNMIPARWSAASLISTQLAVNNYVATAVRALPDPKLQDAIQN